MNGDPRPTRRPLTAVIAALAIVLAVLSGTAGAAAAPVDPGSAAKKDPAQKEADDKEDGKKAKPRIEMLAVDPGEGDQLLVSFTLVDGIDETMERRIESGLATDLDFRFELVRPRRFWRFGFNRTVEKSRLQVVAMYNATSREYLVNYKHDGQLIASRVVRARDELHTSMTEIVEIPLFTLTDLRGDLRLRLRAELGTGSFLFFIPTVRATDWAETRLGIDSDGQVRITTD